MEMPTPLDEPQTGEPFVARLAPLLRTISHRLHGHMVETTAAVGLSAPIAMALRALDPVLPRPMSGLAETLNCDPSNVTAIADRLEEQGLVVRQSAVYDRRVKELVVTSEGAAVRARFIRELERVPLRVDALDDAERATLVDLLGRLLGEDAGCAPAAADASSGGFDRETVGGGGREADEARSDARPSGSAPARRRADRAPR